MKYKLQQASNWYEGVSIDIIMLLKKNGVTVEHNKEIHRKSQSKWDWKKQKDVKTTIKYYSNCIVIINTLEEFNQFCKLIGNIVVFPTYLLLY